MSVTMRFARQVTNTQVSTWDPENPDFPEVYTLFEGFFTGFSGETRTKLKKFRSSQHMFAYLNKLNAGGWMNDDDYNKAWSSVLQLVNFLEIDILSS